LHFGGLQKNSLIDFPGKLSAVLFVSGCNFDCPFCHNPELVKGPDIKLPENEILDLLQKRKGWLDGVVISGGEPTLQNDIDLFCRKVKELNYPIKLDTNGSQPQIVQKLINEGLIDYIAMDIKTDPYLYSPVIAKNIDPETIILSIRLIMESGIPYEFKTTCLKPFIDEEIMERITLLIKGARRYALQRFQKGIVLHPEFFEQNDYQIEEEYFLVLKNIAMSRVGECIVR
jgi:pyruvate formate lyase activating enzyme